jgi:hypothetical protein
MKKIIYITEDIARELQHITQPLSDLPQDIKNVLRNHKTSLGVHPAFPPEEEIAFDYDVTQQRFDEVINNIKKLNLIDYSRDHIIKLIQEKTNTCKDIEKDFKKQLENICYNHIIDLFQVPEGLVAFTCKLVDKIDDNQAQIQNSETIKYTNIKHREKIHDAVYKRRIINCIITGGAIRLSQINKALIGELYELNSDLPKLYKEIITLNEYLLFTKNNIGISEKNKKQAGISYLTIGNETTKNKIDVEAEIFPILLHESIRGFLEMFAAYGLPSSKKESAYVMSKADFLNAEPWDMRIGPILWDKLLSKMDNPNTDMLPMILTLLFSQNTIKFNHILQEIFGDTQYGDNIIEKLLEKAQNEMDIDDFEELMTKKQTDNTIINDQYYLPEEL